MSKKEEFVKFITKNIGDFEAKGASENVINYWNIFCGAEEKEKPEFTNNGKLILKYMQENMATSDMGKAKDIAEGIGISSRTVSGAIRKLVADGYVEKIGSDPAVYAITEKGKNKEII